MTEIAADGDLGDLGKDMIGDAGTGVSPENLAAMKAALADFRVAVSNVSASANQAEQAVIVLESWVTVGQKAMEIIGPIVKTLVAQHVAGNGPVVPGGTVPPALQRITAIAEGLDLFRGNIADGLTPLFHSAPAPA
jgi:hypothetical protein